MMLPPPSSSPSTQIRATATTTTTTTAKRQIWSTVSMSMHHRTSTTTTTAGSIHEGELEVSPVFSRASKAASQAAAGSNSLPIPTTTTSTTSSCKSSSSGLPPPYSATQVPLPSPSPSPKPEEQQTKSSSWRFEIALEGGSCVIKQLGPTMAPPAVLPAEHQRGGATGIMACVKALFSIVAGTVMAFVGVIVSLVAVLVTHIFPSMAAKAPESVARTSSINSRKRKLSPAPGSSSTSSPSIKDRRVLSPSDLSLVGSTSTGGGAASAPAPGIQRHVTFNLERTKSSAAASVSSAGRSSHVDVVGLNTPTVATFAPTEDDEEKDVSEMGVVARAATVSSSAPASSSTSSSGKKRKSWFMKRRSATLASGAGSDVDDSTSDAGAMTNSAPPTPSTLVTELPPVSEEEAGSASDAKGKKEAKKGRGISLKLQFNGKSWKRRSGSSAVFVEAPAAGAEEEGNPESVGLAGADVTTPSSAASSTSVPIPPATSKQQKRRSFPFVGSSSTSSALSHQQPPSTAPIRPTARTNPYGAPYFAAPPTARLTSKSTERRRGSYDDAAGAQSDRESARGHRRAESEDASAGKMPPPVRQDSTGSGFSRASSSLASGTTGSESGLGLEGGVTEMGEFVQPAAAATPTPASPPPAAAATKKTTSPYAKPRLPSTFPVSPLASSSVTASASGRVASDSTALQAQKNSNDSRKRTSSASNRPPVVDRHARMRDAALAWA
ncbi:hypothetical protein FS837_005621, partial [Tulasnella sp. UAMH 9824]